jgi:hypothetical protein
MTKNIQIQHLLWPSALCRRGYSSLSSKAAALPTVQMVAQTATPWLGGSEADFLLPYPVKCCILSHSVVPHV